MSWSVIARAVTTWTRILRECEGEGPPPQLDFSQASNSQYVALVTGF